MKPCKADNHFFDSFVPIKRTACPCNKTVRQRCRCARGGVRYDGVYHRHSLHYKASPDWICFILPVAKFLSSLISKRLNYGHRSLLVHILWLIAFLKFYEYYSSSKPLTRLSSSNERLVDCCYDLWTLSCQCSHEETFL